MKLTLVRIIRILQTQPRLVSVRYQGVVWTAAKCDQCEGFYWRTLSLGYHPPVKRKYRKYCSDECRDTSQRILTNLRQRRWKQRHEENAVIAPPSGPYAPGGCDPDPRPEPVIRALAGTRTRRLPSARRPRAIRSGRNRGIQCT